MLARANDCLFRWPLWSFLCPAAANSMHTCEASAELKLQPRAARRVEVLALVHNGGGDTLKSAYMGAQTDSHADLRLAALTQLYNVVVDVPLQLRVLLRTLAYAKAANLAGLLAPVVKARAHRSAAEIGRATAVGPGRTADLVGREVAAVLRRACTCIKAILIANSGHAPDCMRMRCALSPSAVRAEPGGELGEGLRPERGGPAHAVPGQRRPAALQQGVHHCALKTLHL